MKQGDQVIFKGCICICTVLTVKNKTAVIWEKSTNKALIKRISSLKIKK